ncbi:hypothetical protein GCM10023090_27510 [Acidovorax lacteus]|uniref:PLD phosphodiesterase domain-containing protein n=1 Tax=Acidovorax lacteus TaxID=1924988 RepID=A0ABP8LF71_9BURK
MALLAAGCSSLPAQVQRPVSTAQVPAPDAPLVRWVAEQRSATTTRHASGFALISGPAVAYGSRLAMVESARHTLDLQYYAIHADESTERLLTGIVAAARRGVRVRLLLDDFHSAGQNAQVMRLAFEPGIEMRMFNPVAGIRSSKMGRMLSTLADFSRAQQRMHNKLFIADNVAAVTGGRNLGDAYFGHDEAGNFVDVDVLAIGAVVRQLSATFDWYWNDERSYPVQALIRPEDLDLWRHGPQGAQRSAAAHAAVSADTRPAQPTAGVTSPADDNAAAAERRARVWDQQPLDLRSLRYVWAPAAVLVDQPAKIPADPAAPGTASPGAQGHGAAAPTSAAALAASAALETMPGPPATRPAAAAGLPAVYDPAVPPAEDPSAETVVDGLLALMRQAQRDLTVVSPYFVPGRDILDAFAQARARGVRVRVLTNSLASNDAPIAHAGYARYRPALLDLGVELYELRSEQRGLRSALGAGSGGTAGASRAMLHSKLLVVDERLVAIGSMNLDMRSHRQNTEIALLIRSGTLGRGATAQIAKAMEDAAWKVKRSERGRLVWRAPEGSDLEDSTTEPDASLPLRLLLRVLGPLAPEHLL